MSPAVAAKLKVLYLLYGISLICGLVSASSSSPVLEDCLLNLRLTELLSLKKSLDKIAVIENTTLESRNGQDGTVGANDNLMDQTCERPVAMALMENERGYSKPPSGYHPWQPEEKPSKLQTLFQISITALAFLSFGGYLLCLIVQAIKSKGTTYFHPVATATTTTMNGSVKRIKIYRRSRRELPNEYPLPYELAHKMLKLNSQ